MTTAGRPTTPALPLNCWIDYITTYTATTLLTLPEKNSSFHGNWKRMSKIEDREEGRRSSGEAGKQRRRRAKGGCCCPVIRTQGERKGKKTVFFLLHLCLRFR